MQLVNLQTGKPEDVGDEGLVPALAAGTHVPSGGKALLNPNGELVISPHEDVADNLSKFGYAVPTQEQLDQLSNQQKYGEGVGNELRAFGEGALRGAIPGADYALQALGAEKEGLAQRKELNPISSTTGEITGAVGSALAAPELAPTGLLGKLGTGIAEHLAPAALEEGAGLGARALNAAGQIGAKAAGAAAEGSVYGLGQTVTESALGDPNLAAEHLMSNVGLGGVLGGALGGLLKAGEMAVPASISAAKDALSSGYKKLVGGLDESGTYAAGPLTKAAANVSGALTGEDPAAVIDYAKKMAEGEYLNPKQYSDYKSDFTKGYQKIYDTSEQANYDVATGARKQEIGELTKDLDPTQTALEVGKIHDQISQISNVINKDPNRLSPAATIELERITNALAESVSPQVGISNGAKYEVPATSGSQFLELDSAKKKLGKLVEKLGKSQSLQDNETGSLIREAYTNIKGSLRNSDVWGENAVRYGELNQAISEHIAAKEQFAQEFMTKKKIGGRGVMQMNSGKINNMFNNINDASSEPKRVAAQNLLEKTSNLLDEIEKTNQNTPFGKFDVGDIRDLVEKNTQLANKAQNTIAAQPGMGFSGLSNLATKMGRGDYGPASLLGFAVRAATDPYATINRLSNIERASQAVSNKISKTSSSVFNPIVGAAQKVAGQVGGMLGAEEVKKQYEKSSSQIQKFNSSPQNAVDHLDWATQDMYHAAPNISQAVQMATLRGTNFLNSKIPQPTNQQLPFDKKFEPSHPQMVKFNRYYNAVHRPLAALDDLKTGSVKPESLEAIRTVYPSLYSQIKTELLDSLTSHMAKGNPLPYQQRMAISHFIGEPLDSSMSPQSLKAMQIAHNAPSQQNSENKASPKALGNLTLADRIKTNLQGTSQREAS